MPADVKELLVRMSLDTSAFKKNIADAKGEIKTLREEYKAAASSNDLENVGQTLLKNLQDQKAAAEALVREYKTGIETVQKELDTATPGSQKATALEKQLQTLNTNLATAETNTNKLQTRINEFKFDRFLEGATAAASALNGLKLGLGELLDAAGATADSADQVKVAREAAFTTATKSVEGASQEQLDALNQGLRDMTTNVPLAYEQLAGLLGVGGQLGIPYENLLSFVETMGKLNVATNVTGEEGGAEMAQFINLTEKSYENLDRVAATLVTLGNNSATFESNILAMAHRAASGLSQVGMSSADILAVSAALSSVGIEAQAGGSSVSKLGVTMDKAAKVGARGMEDLLKTASEAYGRQFQSVYELQQLYDELSTRATNNNQGKNQLWEQLGMTKADSENLMKSAMAAEQFSKAMGKTVEQFSADWNKDAASSMVDFFRSLGGMNEGQGENMLQVMDQLGIKEIRQSNMVRALANNWELYAGVLDLARQGYQDNVALDEEAQRAFSTTAAQRQLNANKEQNALEAMGETVTAMRQPFADFFGELQQWYTEWPGWAQTAVAGATEVMGGLGSVLDTAGKLSFSVVSIANAVKDLNASGAGAGIKAIGKGSLLAAGAVGVGAGIVTLAEYLGDISNKTKAVSNDLKGLQITIDPASKDETLRAIAQVKEAADALKGGETEDYSGISKAVQMGYGTAGMYGTALAWEQKQNEEALKSIYSNYGNLIGEQEKALVSAPDDAARQAAQQRIQALTQAMKQEAEAQKAAYGKILSDVLNGAIKQVGQDSALENFSQRYDLLGEVLKNQGMFSSNAVGELYAAMAEDVKTYAQDGGLMNILSTALSSGAFDNADTSQFSGAILGLLQSVDIQQIGEQGAESFQDIGKYSIMGLGQGITENTESAVSAAENSGNSVIDAARRVFQTHSPSKVFMEIGGDLAGGLAQGITGGTDAAVSAMQSLGAAVAAEAARQAALIRAAMVVIAPAPAYASGGSTTTSTSRTSTVTNNFNITSGTLAQQRNVRQLARELTAQQKRANSAVGG